MVARLDADRVFCVIPARAGSTRVPDKNLARVGGVTLLERAIHAALGAVTRVFVSTDSERYASIATAAGATVPGLRPAELATDDAPMDPVVTHALREWGDPGTEVVLLVQPTAPFTTAGDLVAVVRAFDDAQGAACAVTAVPLAPTTAFALVAGPDGLAAPLVPALFDRRSQDIPPLANATGSAFVAPAARVRAGGPLLVAPIALAFVDPEHAVDVDDVHDLARARELAS
ncbi:MAG TPA: acylneuraminate cytidylyltransferase family protein [Acidimicrobiia bacterium]